VDILSTVPVSTLTYKLISELARHRNVVIAVWLLCGICRILKVIGPEDLHDEPTHIPCTLVFQVWSALRTHHRHTTAPDSVAYFCVCGYHLVSAFPIELLPPFPLRSTTWTSACCNNLLGRLRLRCAGRILGHSEGDALYVSMLHPMMRN